MASVAATSSKRLHYYVGAVAVLGAGAVSISVADLVQQPPDWQTQWLMLVALTVASGLLPVTLKTLSVSISISETFVIAGTLLFGPSGGTVLVLLDALFISVRLMWSRKLRIEQLVFNLAAVPFSIFVAGHAAGVQPLYNTTPQFGPWFIGQLAVFTTLYFLCNSWLISWALALQQGTRPREIWSRHFRELLVNYASGGSIAALLVYNTRTVDPFYVAAILPLLVVLFLTLKWTNKQVEAERQKNLELNRVFLQTVEALALAIDAKDQVTHGHIRRVQRYTMALAEELGITDQKELDAIRAAALLHDTGKLAVPEYILNKPGPLTPAEFERMKVHAAVGADILKSIDFPYPVEPIVRFHHEKWNGKGYPQGLKEHEIPVGARILSVVDCYDALTSDRPYRPRMSRQDAEKVLIEEKGHAYDPWVVDGFLGIIDSLEEKEAAHAVDLPAHVPTGIVPEQLDVITATTAEDREFNEMKRDLPRTTSIREASEVLFRHLRRVVPIASLALYRSCSDSNELEVAACVGSGTSAMEGLRVEIGDRISGWAAAHNQVVFNSDAALELGPVARTFPVPLRYVAAVPFADRRIVTVMIVFASDPFRKDYKRLLEAAATLFLSSMPDPMPGEQKAEVSASGRSKSKVH